MKQTCFSSEGKLLIEPTKTYLYNIFDWREKEVYDTAIYKVPVTVSVLLTTNKFIV